MNWEVQTMPSKTSFCNGTEFRKCLSRWWPLWVIYGVILFIMLPGVLLNARSTIPYVSTEQSSYLSNVILSETQMLLPLTAFCAGLLAEVHEQVQARQHDHMAGEHGAQHGDAVEHDRLKREHTQPDEQRLDDESEACRLDEHGEAEDHGLG